jgi:Ca2+-binding EF-hand superfamily protein
VEESLVALIDRPDFTVPNIFGVIDRSSDQNITFSEFRDTYKVFEVAVTSADLQLLFARYDSRGADALSLEDFKKMFSPKDVNSRVLLLCRPYLRG